MRSYCKCLSVLGLVFTAFLANAEQFQLSAVRYTEKPAMQIGFELSGQPHYRYFLLQKPSRLVIDFQNTAIRQPLALPPAEHPLLLNMRSAVRNANDLRVVFELNGDAGTVKPILSQLGSGALLQLSLTPQDNPIRKDDAVVPVRSTKKAVPPQAKHASSKPIEHKSHKHTGRDIVVAIDAGHGGKDVGAQGANGTQEKDVVFAIAVRLESLINRQPGMRAFMTRKGDYFVKLRERVRLAHEAKADLFVSIHADAFADASARGASVYTLANKGASSAAARWLAESENAADTAGGEGMDEHDNTLVSVLQDLSHRAAKEASQNIGNKVLKSVKKVGHLHRSAVQKAGFVVLKSPDIPSILVETAFISNPAEERNLTSGAYQSKMATAVFTGILAHFRQYAPANTLMAQQSASGRHLHLAARKDAKPTIQEEQSPLVGKVADGASGFNQVQHVVRRGETLYGIAQQYGVSMRVLRQTNSMADSEMKAGQVLQIPHDG